MATLRFADMRAALAYVVAQGDYGSQNHYEPYDPLLYRLEVMQMAEEVKPRICTYCKHVYLKPCDGASEDCENKKHIDKLDEKTHSEETCAQEAGAQTEEV